MAGYGLTTQKGGLPIIVKGQSDRRNGGGRAQHQ
jgi:hypothetical protein